MQKPKKKWEKKREKKRKEKRRKGRKKEKKTGKEIKPETKQTKWQKVYGRRNQQKKDFFTYFLLKKNVEPKREKEGSRNS